MSYLAVAHDDFLLVLAAMHRFVAVFKRDKHSPPPLVADQANSSASSSTGSASLCLHTPDDDQHLPAAVERQASRRSWRLWLNRSLKKTQQPPLWVPTSHDVDDVPSESSLHDDPPVDPLQSLTVLVQDSLQPAPPPPSPFSRCSDDPSMFPKSANRTSLLPRNHSLASVALKRHILKRLQDERHTFTQAELRSIAPLASRPITPVVPLDQPHHPFNVSAPSKNTVISTSCPGLATWVSRPCFEDRYDLFMPEQDGTISHRPIVGSNLAVAALEYSEGLEAMADPTSPQSVVDISSETVSISPSSSGHSRSPPHIPAPSPLRNEHNLPAPPSVSATQSAPPAVPTSTETDSSVKRGVRFAEDGKDDIPLAYVLRTKKKREEKAKFLKAEQERRLLEEERMRYEEERRKRDAERAEWERERRAWEKEKRVMEDERRQRKYAEEVTATRFRRESQRAGGVPALKASESNAFLGPNPGAGFPASAPSSTSERNRPSPAHRYSRFAYNESGAPTCSPRREASEPNLPIRIDTNPAPSLPITPSPRSHSPSSSPASVAIERPLSPDRSSPLPGTRPSSINSQELPLTLENIKASAAATANQDKRHSFVAPIPTSRNNSKISLSGDRATSYPVWTGSNHSLNNMLAPVPMIHPLQMPMMPVPAYAMMDMPLLPPAPPFMMQHYPRHNGSPRSPGSGGGSPKGRLRGSSTSSSRERLDPQNPSRERVNAISGAARSGSVERGYAGGTSSHFFIAWTSVEFCFSTRGTSWTDATPKPNWTVFAPDRWVAPAFVTTPATDIPRSPTIANSHTFATCANVTIVHTEPSST
ncbi:hypothetical protein C0992_000811 [Termitomyces sp. T32_za158]|nr:hypothetical protein C0992_000811 [Termitomyces sp. T32_za158]